MNVTVTVNSKKPLVVPAAIRKQAGLKSGDEIEFKVSGRVITIHQKKPVDDDYTPAQRREIDRGIAQSEKEYAAGKSYGPFDTAEEAIAAIDTNLRRRAASKKSKPTGR